jgi:tetratricopeptide (TPR) repeat protein
MARAISSLRRVLIFSLSTALWAAGLTAQPAAAPCDAARSEALAASARKSLAQKRYDGAAADLRAAAEACPQRRGLLLELAQALALQRDFDAARRAAGEFLAAEPGSEQGLLVLADVELMSLRFPECIRLADSILARNSKSLPALKLKANAQYLAGEESEAVASLRAAIALSPNDEEAPYSLGRIYYQQNRFEPAAAQFRRVLEINPKSYKAYDNLGLCYEALNKDEEAVRFYLKALDLVYKDHRDYEWPYANLANLLLKRGENEKAFQLAAEAAARNPNSARNFFLTGKALARLQKLDLSIKWLKRSAELDPSYPEPHYLLAQVYQKLGRNEEAQREFRVFQEISAKMPRTRR